MSNVVLKLKDNKYCQLTMQFNGASRGHLGSPRGDKLMSVSRW